MRLARGSTDRLLALRKVISRFLRSYVGSSRPAVCAPLGPSFRTTWHLPITKKRTKDPFLIYLVTSKGNLITELSTIILIFLLEPLRRLGKIGRAPNFDGASLAKSLWIFARKPGRENQERRPRQKLTTKTSIVL